MPHTKIFLHHLIMRAIVTSMDIDQDVESILDDQSLSGTMNNDEKGGIPHETTEMVHGVEEQVNGWAKLISPATTYRAQPVTLAPSCVPWLTN